MDNLIMAWAETVPLSGRALELSRKAWVSATGFAWDSPESEIRTWLYRAAVSSVMDDRRLVTPDLEVFELLRGEMDKGFADIQVDDLVDELAILPPDEAINLFVEAFYFYTRFHQVNKAYYNLLILFQDQASHATAPEY